MANKYRDHSRKAQRDRIRVKSCILKRRYESEDAARQKGQDHYKCPYCNGWHRSGAFSRLVAKAHNSNRT